MRNPFPPGARHMLALLLLSLLPVLSSLAQVTYIWHGGHSNNQWSDVKNWQIAGTNGGQPTSLPTANDNITVGPQIHHEPNQPKSYS